MFKKSCPCMVDEILFTSLYIFPSFLFSTVVKSASRFYLHGERNLNLRFRKRKQKSEQTQLSGRIISLAGDRPKHTSKEHSRSSSVCDMRSRLEVSPLQISITVFQLMAQGGQNGKTDFGAG